jgi:hypothetical protein
VHAVVRTTRGLEHGQGLVVGEPQLLDPDVDDIAPEPMPGQVQRRRAASQQRHGRR